MQFAKKCRFHDRVTKNVVVCHPNHSLNNPCPQYFIVIIIINLRIPSYKSRCTSLQVYKSKYTTFAYNTANVNVLKYKSTKTLGLRAYVMYNKEGVHVIIILQCELSCWANFDNVLKSFKCSSCKIHRLTLTFKL